MGGPEPLDLEELVRENENLREQRQAVDEVLRAVARSEGLQPVLDAIIAAARRLCHGDHAQLYLAEGDVFVIVSQVLDLPEGYDYAVEHPHRRDRTTVVGRTALAGKAVQIPDVLADADYSFGAQRIIGYRALLGVPVFLDDELIGVVSVGRSVPGPFADREVQLVKTFADQAAIAIANARLLDTVERQRTELSRFLSPQVAALISSDEGERLLAGHRAYITCLFSDLRGFTAFAETAAPEELFEVLRPYHETIGDLIPRHGGTLEHFAGDGIMSSSTIRSRSTTTSSQRSGSRSPPKSGSRSWRARGASGAPSWDSGSGSRRGTRRWAASASRVATTTRRSDRLRTSPRGSAPTPPRVRSWSARGSSRSSRRRSSSIPSGASS